MRLELLILLVAATACSDTTGDVDGGHGTDARVGTDGGGGRTDGGGGASDARVDGPSGGDDGGPVGLGCAGRDYLFCEDFEGAAAGSLPSGWSVGSGWQMGGSDPEVSEDEHHSGTRSLASAVATNGQRRAEHSLEDLASARGTHWGRIFYRVKLPVFLPTGGSVVHNTFVALLSSTGESRVVDTVAGPFGSAPDAHQFLYNLPDDSCCAGTGYDYQSYDDAWHCAEWYVDAATQSFQFYYDGEELEEIGFTYGAGDTRARIEAFEGIAVGWRNYQTPDMPYVSYFDDLALDDERIGCE